MENQAYRAWGPIGRDLKFDLELMQREDLDLPEAILRKRVTFIDCRFAFIVGIWNNEGGLQLVPTSEVCAKDDARIISKWGR